MTKEEFLAEAIRKYPVGTVFISPHSGSSFTVGENPKYSIEYDSDEQKLVIRVSYSRFEPFLFKSGKWAEIIREVAPPEPVVLNNYEIY